MKKQNKINNDNMPLFSAKHKFYPGKKWYQKIVLRIKGLFVRPRFSANAIEPAQNVIDQMMKIMDEDRYINNNYYRINVYKSLKQDEKEK